MSPNRTTAAANNVHVERVKRSAAWAAWADALGFISELTDQRGLQRRLGEHGPQLRVPVAWRRRVGGRFGAEAALPAGCYSDDTQLRLAVGRAITGAGFDVEAFARVELPVWPAYALGGGHSSKAAAKNLARPGTAWFANFYQGWTNGGGNGVAMRIQPHVWSAAHPLGLGAYLRDVLANAVTTHGHPRALFGAVIHAAALGQTLTTGTVPGPEHWQELLTTAATATDLIDDHPEIDGYWRPSWESQVGRPFSDAWAETAAECEKLLTLAAELSQDSRQSGTTEPDSALISDSYETLVRQLGLDGDELRGSGLHTVVAALALSAMVGADPRAAAITAAQIIGTDTDTIATMSAAVSAAADNAEAAPEILDSYYISQEAQRLASIAAGERTERFSYPDLLNWVAPRTQLDACGLTGGLVALSGLGWCEPLSDQVTADSRGNIWRWMQTDFGQSVLLKQRSQLQALPKGAWPTRRGVIDTGHLEDDQGPKSSYTDKAAAQSSQSGRDIPRGGRTPQRGTGDNRAMEPGLAERSEPRHDATEMLFDRNIQIRDNHVSVDALYEWVAQRRFSTDALGKALRRLAEVGTVDQVVAFSVLVHASARHYRRGDGVTSI